MRACLEKKKIIKKSRSKTTFIVFQVYPKNDITNIVESSHYVKIGNWCKMGYNKCKHTDWVKPYRCLGKCQRRFIYRKPFDRDEIKLLPVFVWPSFLSSVNLPLIPANHPPIELDFHPNRMHSPCPPIPPLYPSPSIYTLYSLLWLSFLIPVIDQLPHTVHRFLS